MANPRDEDLRVAIELFRKSSESETRDGKKVLESLDKAFKLGKITFQPLGGADGEQDSDWIHVEQTLVDPGAISSTLVHEGYHLAGEKRELYIDEEIHSRELQARYLLILERTIMVDGKSYTILKNRKVVQEYRNNQIVDWVLTMPYRKKPNFLTQNWVAQHIDDWGGPGNRTEDSKADYLKVLAQAPAPADMVPVGRAIATLLPTMKAPDVSKIATILGNGDFNAGVKLLKLRISGAQIMGDATSKALAEKALRWLKEKALDIATGQ